jgi:hypothetical protein
VDEDLTNHFSASVFKKSMLQHSLPINKNGNKPQLSQKNMQQHILAVEKNMSIVSALVIKITMQLHLLAVVENGKIYEPWLSIKVSSSTDQLWITL